MLVTDFYLHRPEKRYKMLLETCLTGQTVLPRLETISGWKLPSAGTSAENIQPEGGEHFWTGE